MLKCPGNVERHLNKKQKMHFQRGFDSKVSQEFCHHVAQSHRTLPSKLVNSSFGMLPVLYYVCCYQRSTTCVSYSVTCKMLNGTWHAIHWKLQQQRNKRTVKVKWAFMQPGTVRKQRNKNRRMSHSHTHTHTHTHTHKCMPCSKIHTCIKWNLHAQPVNHLHSETTSIQSIFYRLHTWARWTTHGDDDVIAQEVFLLLHLLLRITISLQTPTGHVCVVWTDS
jgi:hypothetical protein